MSRFSGLSSSSCFLMTGLADVEESIKLPGKWMVEPGKAEGWMRGKDGCAIATTGLQLTYHTVITNKPNQPSISDSPSFPPLSSFYPQYVYVRSFQSSEVGDFIHPHPSSLTIFKAPGSPFFCPAMPPTRLCHDAPSRNLISRNGQLTGQ